MIFQYASDLHLEFKENEDYLLGNPIIPSAPILILAGDIDMIRKKEKVNSSLFKYFSENWEQTYIIPGNHEFYKRGLIQRGFRLNFEVFPNVQYVNHRMIEIQGVEFYFTTLWSEIKSPLVTDYISDFRACRWGSKPYKISHHTTLHHKALGWLNDNLKQKKSKPRVVVSHFVPSLKVDKYPVGDDMIFSSLMKEYFVARLDEYLDNWDIDYWIYGHSHWNHDCEEFGIKFRSNMLGYVNMEEHTRFEHDKVIEVEG